MKTKDFCLMIAVLGGLGFIFHVYRLLTGLVININGWNVPGWTSLVGVMVSGFFAYTGYNLANKK